MVAARVTELIDGAAPNLYEAGLAARTGGDDQKNKSVARACLSLAGVFAKRREFVFAVALLDKFFALKGGMDAFFRAQRARTLRRRRQQSAIAASAGQWACLADCYAIARNNTKAVRAYNICK